MDLDGVVWLTGEAIGPVGRAVDALRTRGIRVVFATNNSAPTTDELLRRLERIGIHSSPEDLATSAAAAASLLQPGQRVRVLAEGGVLESLADRGRGGPWARRFGGGGRRGRMEPLLRLRLPGGHRHGSPGVGPAGSDQRGPHAPDARRAHAGFGSPPGRGGHGLGRHPEIAGKPHDAMAALMRQRFGFGDGDPPW